MLKFTGQVSNRRGLSSALFGVGGMGTVRGYPISTVSGDMGYNVSAEYTVPFLAKDFPKMQTVSFITFLEHGQIYVRDPQPGEINQHITGAGGGLKIVVPKGEGDNFGINFALTYGVPVFNSIPPADSSHGIIYLNGMINY